MFEVFDHDRLTVNQVAKRLHVHVATVWRWVLQGVRGKQLHSHLIGGRRYILGRDLLEFIAPAHVDLTAMDSNNRADMTGRQASFVHDLCLYRNHFTNLRRHRTPSRTNLVIARRGLGRRRRSSFRRARHRANQLSITSPN